MQEFQVSCLTLRQVNDEEEQVEEGEAAVAVAAGTVTIYSKDPLRDMLFCCFIASRRRLLSTLSLTHTTAANDSSNLFFFFLLQLVSIHATTDPASDLDPDAVLLRSLHALEKESQKRGI